MMACVASDAVPRASSCTSVSVATSVSRRARPRPGSSLRSDPTAQGAARGACGGLDCACARRAAELWATAEGWRSGSGSGWLAADGGLLPSGRHKLHRMGTDQLGLEGQSEPVEPVSVLDPTGGDQSTLPRAQHAATAGAGRARERERREVKRRGQDHRYCGPNRTILVRYDRPVNIIARNDDLRVAAHEPARLSEAAILLELVVTPRRRARVGVETERAVRAVRRPR